MLGGLKTGTRLALWTGAFVALEEGFELGLARYIVPAAMDDGGVPFKTRWASGAVAGLGLAGAAGQICEYLWRCQPEIKVADGLPTVQTDCRGMEASAGSCSACPSARSLVERTI